MENAGTSRSWFCVFNNPADHGYEGKPEEILERLRNEWVTDENPERTGAWVYCISASGLPHVHMVLEDTKSMRFNAVKKSYAIGMHFEATKGKKKQVIAYIEKTGVFEEKGEQIIAKLVHGEIVGRVPKGDSNRTIYDELQELLDVGLTPSDILAMSVKYCKYERTIRTAFIAKRANAIPIIKKMRVYWHIGKSGTGKSYTYKKLCDEHGEKNVFFLNDYMNGGLSALDGYVDTMAEILFIDEYKGAFPFSVLLAILGENKCQIHARYNNCYNAWNIVHVTSVYTPMQIYNMAVPEDRQQQDPYLQLLRRIHYLVYHYKVGNEYCTYEIPMTDFVSLTKLHQDALASHKMSKVTVVECTRSDNDYLEGW